MAYVATGEAGRLCDSYRQDLQHKRILEKTFSYLELDWQKYVKQDPRFMRPAEVIACRRLLKSEKT